MKVKFTKEDKKRLAELNYRKNSLLEQIELCCMDLSSIERLRIRVMASKDKMARELESFQTELMELHSASDYLASYKYEKLQRLKE